MDRKGYSLVELLIVVAIIAMVAGLGIPTFARSAERAEIKSTAGNVAALMRLARNEAIAQKRFFTVLIDTEKRIAYAIEGRFDRAVLEHPLALGGETIDIPEGVKLWIPDENPYAVEFSPAGTASLCDLPVTAASALADNDNGYRLRVEPLSGRAKVVRVEG